MYRKLQNIYIKYQNIYKKENSFSFRSSWFDISEKKSAVINLQYMHNMRSHVLWRRENVLAAQSMKWYGQFGWQQERLFGLNKKKCWMFARAKKAWPLLLRRIYKLVEQFHKVSIMQYLMPGKKTPNIYTYYLQTAESLQACLLNILSTANTTPGRILFPPHFYRGSPPSAGFLQYCHSLSVLSGTGQNESETKCSPHSFQRLSGIDKPANWISLGHLRSSLE